VTDIKFTIAGLYSLRAVVKFGIYFIISVRLAAILNQELRLG
jgi:hypothetical protein